MTEPIWKRVQRCAEELTKDGVTPFTRGDLIRCIQRRDPECSPDSINPIIQGLTDNLQGGVPSAAGKDLLHSVGRGLFVLKNSGASNPHKEPVIHSRASNPQVNSSSLSVQAKAHTPGPLPLENGVLNLDGYGFKFICGIDPERNDDGTVREFMPQPLYSNASSVSLNRYGLGPFCKFKIPRKLERAGVYALAIEGEVQYVGECENLSSRFNLGYGIISPRNCYVGGQETNCRINNLLLERIKRGLAVTLWFHETDDHKLIESKLRESGRFIWNRV